MYDTAMAESAYAVESSRRSARSASLRSRFGAGTEPRKSASGRTKLRGRGTSRSVPPFSVSAGHPLDPQHRLFRARGRWDRGFSVFIEL